MGLALDGAGGNDVKPRRPPRKPMTHRTISADKFRKRCLGLIEEVQKTGREIVITKHGKPFARLLPVEASSAPKSLFGYMRGTIKVVGDIVEPLYENSPEVRESDRRGPRRRRRRT
jgi:prevent-host-death family protein